MGIQLGHYLTPKLLSRTILLASLAPLTLPRVGDWFCRRAERDLGDVLNGCHNQLCCGLRGRPWLVAMTLDLRLRWSPMDSESVTRRRSDQGVVVKASAFVRAFYDSPGTIYGTRFQYFDTLD